MENENNNDHKQLSFEISKVAVTELKIPLLILEGREKRSDLRYEIFYQEREDNILLSIEFYPLFTRAFFHISLSGFVWNVIGDLNLLFSNAKNLELLGLGVEEKDDVIYEKSLQLAKDFILYLPVVIFHSIHKSAKETVISHIKKVVDYDLRDVWIEKKLPKDYSLVKDNNFGRVTELYPQDAFGFLMLLDWVDEEFNEYRKGAYSDRKVWLVPEIINNLPNEYEKLRARYAKAKKEHKSEHTAFTRINRRSTIDDWESHWKSFFVESFPDLSQAEDIKNFTASQLAYRHLAVIFGYNPDYMQKIVLNAQAAAKGRNRLVKNDGY